MFDPDKYLQGASSFDPDAYLSSSDTNTISEPVTVNKRDFDKELEFPSFTDKDIQEVFPASPNRTIGRIVKPERVKEYGLRRDGTPKGAGYFGEIKNEDGTFSTELSINVDGREIPVLVPTLTDEEIRKLQVGGEIPQAIVDKAVKHAAMREAQGKSPFADMNEQSPRNRRFNKAQQRYLDWLKPRSNKLYLQAKGLGYVADTNDYEMQEIKPEDTSWGEDIINSLSRNTQDLAVNFYGNPLLKPFQGSDVKDEMKLGRQYRKEEDVKYSTSGNGWVKDTITEAIGMVPYFGAGAVASVAGGPVAAGAFFSTAGGGEIYQELEDLGIDDSVSIPVAMVGGTVYGLIENMQMLQAFPGLKKMGNTAIARYAKKLTQNAASKALKKKVRNKILHAALKLGGKRALKLTRGAGRYAGTVIAESLEESMQEGVKVTSEHVAAALNNLKNDTEILKDSSFTREALERMTGAFTESIGPMMLIAGFGHGTYKLSKRLDKKITSRRLKKQQERLSKAYDNLNQFESKYGKKHTETLLNMIENEDISLVKVAAFSPEKLNRFMARKIAIKNGYDIDLLTGKAAYEQKPLTMPEADESFDQGDFLQKHQGVGEPAQRMPDIYDEAMMPEPQQDIDITNEVVEPAGAAIQPESDVEMPDFENMTEAEIEDWFNENDDLQEDPASLEASPGQADTEIVEPVSIAGFERLDTLAPVQQMSIGELDNELESLENVMKGNPGHELEMEWFRRADELAEEMSRRVDVDEFEDLDSVEDTDLHGDIRTITDIENKVETDPVIAELSEKFNSPVERADIGDDKQALQLKAVADSMNIPVRFVKMGKGDAVNGFEYKGEAFINVDSDNPGLATLAHETVHVLQDRHKDLWEQFKGNLEKLYSGDNYKEWAEAKAAATERRLGVKPSQDVLMRELAAYLVEEQAHKESFWKNLKDVDASLLEKILAIFKEIKDSLSKITAKDSDIQKIFGEQLDQAIKAGEDFINKANQGKEKELSTNDTKVDSNKQPEQKIEDFGGKIGGARKDYADKLAHAMRLDVAKAPLSKAWPEPDYGKLLESGTDPFVVSFVRAAHDEIPMKPRNGWKLKQYSELVKTLRDFSERLLSGELDTKDIKERLESNDMLKGISGRIALYQEMGHDNSFKGVSLSHDHYTLYKGEKNVKKWIVSKKRKATSFNNFPQELASGNTREEAIANFKRFLQNNDLNKKSDSERKTKFDVYRYRRKDSKFYIGKKIGKNTIDLFTFDSSQEARAFLNDNYDDVLARLESYKNIAKERRDKNSPRIGKDYRKGKDVTPEMFQDAFSFRGVEFGNYVEQERRQADLNRAYDSLHDLAGILNIPSRAISLNGELGLAFGARGKGGKNAPAAHYEPDRVVINLTKKQGPGSLAHEWWHALDYYLANKGEASTENPAVSFAAMGLDFSRQMPENTRKELIEAFGNIVKTVRDSKLPERSKELDKRRTKDYWSQMREMSARAFENYVVERLKAKQASNDYLANIRDISSFAEAMLESFADGKTGQDSYPYLTTDELPAFREAFDNFFKTVKTKTGDDGNVILFSLKDNRNENTRKYLEIGEPPADMPVLDSGLKVISKWLRDHYRNMPISMNKHKEWKIKITGTGIRETLNHIKQRVKTPQKELHYRTLPFIDQMLEKAKWIKDEADKRFKADYVSKFELPVKIDGKEYRVVMIIKHYGEDKNYYDHRLTKFEELPERGLTPHKAENPLVSNSSKDNNTPQSDKSQAVNSEQSAVSREPDIKLSINTPEFKEWFGNSKVVDENGEPLVVYHGTDKDFSVFEEGYGKGFKERGIFFSDSKAVAETYGETKLKSVYLSIKNPLIIDANGNHWLNILFEGKKINSDLVAGIARERGYDGAIIKNVQDPYMFKGNSYIAFSPSQIKSIHNSGSWDGSNPDINLSLSDDRKQDYTDWLQERYNYLVELEHHFPNGVKPDKSKYGKKEEFTGSYIDFKNGENSDVVAHYLGMDEDDLLERLNGLQKSDLRQEHAAEFRLKAESDRIDGMVSDLADRWDKQQQDDKQAPEWLKKAHEVHFLLDELSLDINASSNLNTMSEKIKNYAAMMLTEKQTEKKILEFAEMIKSNDKAGLIKELQNLHYQHIRNSALGKYEKLAIETRELKKQLIDQRKTIQKKQMILHKYIKSNLPRENRSQFYGKLASLSKYKKSETVERHLMSVLEDVENHAEQIQKSHLVEKLQETFRKELQRMRNAGKLGRKSDIAYEQNVVLKEIINHHYWGVAKHFDAEKHPDMKNIHTMEKSELARVLLTIESIKQTGRSLKAYQEYELKKEIRYQADTAKLEVLEHAPKDFDQFQQALDKSNKPGALKGFYQDKKGFLDRTNLAMIAPETMIESLAGFEENSNLYQNTWEPLYNAELTKLHNLEQAKKDFEDIHSPLELEKNGRKILKKTFLELNVENPGKSSGKYVRKLTIDDLMGMYAHSKNDFSRRHLIATMLTYAPIKDDQAINALNYALDKLPQEYKDVVDRQISYYDNVMYDRINDVFRRMHGVDMIKEHNYFPIQNIERRNENVLDMLSGDIERTAKNTKKGFTAERQGSSNPFKSLSYMNTVVSHMHDTEHMIALSEAVWQVREFLNNPVLKNSLEHKNKFYHGFLQRWVDDVAFGRFRPPESAFGKKAEKARLNMTSAVLGFNPKTPLKQPVSIIQGASMCKSSEITRAMAIYSASPVKTWAMIEEKDITMRARVNQLNITVSKIMEDEQTERMLNAQNILPKTRELGFWAIRQCDKYGSGVVWLAKYNEVKQNGGSEKEAIKEARRVVRLTQPQGGIINLPDAYRRNEFFRWFSSFTNQLNKNYNLFQRATKGFKGNKKQSFKIFLGFAISGAMIQIVNKGFGLSTLWEEPDELARTTLNTVTGGHPLLGMISDYGARSIIAGQRKEAGYKVSPWYGNLAEASIPPLARGWMDLLEAAGETTSQGEVSKRYNSKKRKEIADKRITKALDKSIRGTMMIFGIPGYYPLSYTVKNWDTFTATNDPRYLMMSKSSLSPTFRKKKKRKSAGRGYGRFSSRF